MIIWIDQQHTIMDSFKGFNKRIAIASAKVVERTETLHMGIRSNVAHNPSNKQTMIRHTEAATISPFDILTCLWLQWIWLINQGW